MKTTRLLFTIIGFGALTLGLGFADEPPKQLSKPEARENPASVRPAVPKRSQVNDDGHAPEKSSHAVPINPQHKSTPVNELHQPALRKTAISPNDGLLANKAANHLEQPAKLPVGSGTTAPRPGVVRSRSVTAAVIGGPTPSNTKHSAAAIDGTAIQRKP
jgi:hypothetical protein